MKPKKQLALGTVLLAATAAACVNLAKWADKKIHRHVRKIDQGAASAAPKVRDG